MKKTCHLKSVVVGIAFISVIVLGFAQSSFAQDFISREARLRWDDRYENFSNYDLRKYPGMLTSNSINPARRGPADPVTFDQFGNFLLPGGNVYSMVWDRSVAGATKAYSANANIFNSLMISSDEFSNWVTKFMVGRNLRAYFTPSTLKRTNFDGIRWDASSRKNSFTFLASVGDRPGVLDPAQPSNYRNLFGLYWQSILGDVLKIGGTFVAQQRGTQSYSNKDIGSGKYGLSLTDMERYVYVVITDDSPESDEVNGAVVYDIKAFVNGKEDPNIRSRVFKVEDIITEKLFTEGDWSKQYLFRADPSVAYIRATIEDFQYTTYSWFLDLMNSVPDGGALRQLFIKTDKAGVLGYVNVPDFNDPLNPTGRHYYADTSRGHIEANGTDVIIYEFLVPEETRQLDFSVLVANDYCIDIVSANPSRQSMGTAPWDDRPGQENWEGKWSPIYDVKHCKRAPGKVTDFSNTNWVKISYNRLTGINAYGLNLELNWEGLFIRGEINEYNALWAYPIRDSFMGEAHETTNARAWFLNIEKDFGRFSVGGELFDYPKEYMEYWAPIDDNDDNDYRIGTDQGMYDGDPSAIIQGSEWEWRPKLEVATDSDWEYPGLNIDFDRAPEGLYIDTRWTGEPYLTYYFDKMSFGDDFNHNGIIDERENDASIDLPYDRDSKGQHYFVKLKPSEYTFLTYGHYRIEQDYQKGRNLTDYVKAEHFQRLNNLFEFGVYHRLERVHDNYKSNKYYRQYTSLQDPSWDPSGRFNNLAYRDSWVNSSMLKTRLTLIPNLNIINNFKYDSILRVGDQEVVGSYVQKGLKAPKNIIYSASVHKVDYTFRLADFRINPDVYWRGYRILKEHHIREFTIKPQFKLESTYYTADLHTRNNSGHYISYFPVLRFDYQVAPKTTLRCAFQGFPGFMEKRRDSGHKLHDVNRRRFFIGFETTTLYQGFNLLVTTGVRRDKQEWVKSYGRREIGNTEYFVTIRCEAGR